MTIESPKAEREIRQAGEIQSRISPWLASSLKPIHSLFMRMYFRIQVHNPERVPQDGPVILAPTHRSRWDTFFLHLLTRRYPRFMTSQDEFVGVQGWFIRRLGAFPVNTRRPTAGVMRHCRELLLAGEPLVIFPEGTLFYDPPDHIHPIKPGVSWLALDCQRRLPDVKLRILPIRLNYGDRKLRFRSRVDVVVKEPIVVSEYLDQPREQAIAALSADMERALGDIVNTSNQNRIPDRTPHPDVEPDGPSPPATGE
ncbi:lysophospholipid acyltransferase family protein [soil metagenome]